MNEQDKIAFSVVGQALPAGSKTSFPVLDKQGNPIRSKTGRLITRAKNSNPKTEDWMGRIAQRAREVYAGPLLLGALRLTLVFVRARPKGHFGTGKNEGNLKGSAPAHPTTQPDLVKLARAVEDSLVKILFVDDSQIVEHHLRKIWGEYYHLDITLETLGRQQDG